MFCGRCFQEESISVAAVTAGGSRRAVQDFQDAIHRRGQVFLELVHPPVKRYHSQNYIEKATTANDIHRTI